MYGLEQVHVLGRDGGRVSWGPHVVVGVLLVNRQWDPMGSGHMGPSPL